jgi:hypothetical protein
MKPLFFLQWWLDGCPVDGAGCHWPWLVDVSGAGEVDVMMGPEQSLPLEGGRWARTWVLPLPLPQL